MLEIQQSNVNAEDIPMPVGYRMLVEPIRVEEKTAGGIVLANEAVKAKEYLRYVGRVVAVGGSCYQHEKFDETRWCEEGDWIAYGQHAGQEIKVRTADGKGHAVFKLLNDDEVLAKIPNPEAVLIYV